MAGCKARPLTSSSEPRNHGSGGFFVLSVLFLELPAKHIFLERNTYAVREREAYPAKSVEDVERHQAQAD